MRVHFDTGLTNASRLPCRSLVVAPTLGMPRSVNRAPVWPNKSCVRACEVRYVVLRARHLSAWCVRWPLGVQLPLTWLIKTSTKTTCTCVQRQRVVLCRCARGATARGTAV